MAIGIIFFADKSASWKFTDRKCSDCGACFREKRRENFFLPEPKRKSSRATFCGASKQKIVARKRFAGWLSFSVPFSLFGLNSAALSISRARTLYMQCVSFLWLHAVSHFFGLFLYSLSFRCASTFSDLSLGRNSSAYRCRLILLSIRALP